MIRRHTLHATRRPGRLRLVAAAVAACFAGAFVPTALATPPAANALPTGFSNLSGIQAQNIVQSGNQLAITTSAARSAADVASFSIGSAARVDVTQPGAGSAALFRVTGNDPSKIYGTLASNGSVWLINTSGITVGPGGIVDTAGFVASTLNVSREDFLAGRLAFTATPGAGAVVNQGTIKTPAGGSVYLIGAEVENRASILTPGGETILAAGETVRIADTGTPGVSVAITGAAGKATNLGTIAAEAGRIGIVGAIVRNSGTLNADSAVSEGGRIFLRATRQIVTDETSVISANGKTKGGEIIAKTEENGQLSGTIDVAGQFLAKGDGSAGNGGFVETSADKVSIAPGVAIDTGGGTWLIDPQDFRIQQSGGDVTGTQISNLLANNNVVIETINNSQPNSGDIVVNDEIGWNSSSKLTLRAINDIVVKKEIESGGSGSVVLRADSDGNNAGTVRFDGQGKLVFTGSGRGDIYYNPSGGYALPDTFSTAICSPCTAWMLVNDVGQESGGSRGLQAIQNNLAGYYALGRDIDASGTASWNGGAGFAPLGDGVHPFSGTFDGLGQKITGLTINRSGAPLVGLFGAISSTGIVRNVGLENLSISGGSTVGGLAGSNDGIVSNSFVTGTVTASGFVGGGLIGNNAGTISNSYSGANVSGVDGLGGLVGANDPSGHISASYASGQVSGAQRLGGLVGINTAIIETSYASGDVIGTGDRMGGLVGINNGSIQNAYARGNVSGGSDKVGGLVGYHSSGSVTNTYAAGTVATGSGDRGALIGFSTGSIASSAWNQSANGSLQGIGNVSVLPSDVVGLSEAQMKQATPLLSPFSSWSSSVWTFSGSDYPTLNNVGTSSGNSSGGSTVTLGSTSTTSTSALTTAAVANVAPQVALTAAQSEGQQRLDGNGGFLAPAPLATSSGASGRSGATVGGEPGTFGGSESESPNDGRPSNEKGNASSRFQCT